MEKRILSIITALALCMGLLPTAVFATDETTYPIYVSGTQVTESNKDDILQGDETNGGKVSYDPTTKTLTLGDGASIAAGKFNLGHGDVWRPLYADGDLVLCVSGNAAITGTGDVDLGLEVTGALTITGGGTLTVSSSKAGIDADSITVIDTSLIVTSENKISYRNISWSTGYVGFEQNYSNEMVEITSGYAYTTHFKIVKDTRTPLPAPNAVLIADSGVASWDAVQGAAQYRVTLYRVGEDAEIYSDTTSYTTYKLNDWLPLYATASGAYYVTVQSSKATDQTQYKAGDVCTQSNNINAYSVYVNDERANTYLAGATADYYDWSDRVPVEMPYGAVFDGWNGLDGVTLSDGVNVTDQLISFIMPAQDVYLTYSYTMGDISAFPVYVEGTQITKENMSDVLGDGSVSFTYTNDGTATLYLKDATLNVTSYQYDYYGYPAAADGAVHSDIPLTISFAGTNVITNELDYGYCFYDLHGEAFYFDGEPGSSLTVRGGRLPDNSSFGENVIVHASTSADGSGLESFDQDKHNSYAYNYYLLTVPIPPAAPTGISGVNETIKGKNDGKITGVNATMEYKMDGAAEYTSISGSELTGLAAGTYYVRCKATDNTIASEAVEITIAEGTPLKLTFYDYSLGISDISYGETGNAAFNRINNSTGLDVGNEFIPIRDGYDFLGWYTALDGGEKYDFDTPIIENTTVYPHWIAFSFDTSDRTATYGDGTLEARTATAEGTVSYSSSNESVAFVDGNGVVTVLNAGETTITASLAATEGHAGIFASYKLTVDPKPLTVTTADKTVYVGSQKPDLSTAEFTVNGIVNGDEGNVNVTLSYATEPDMSKAGEYAITATTTNDNYTIASVTGKLTVRNRPSSGGTSSGGASNTTTETEKNEDGSTTTTTTNEVTGTVTETTKNTDGSTNTVVTEKGGTVTETNKTANGVTGTTVTDKDGDVTEISAKVPASAAKDAEQSGEPVTLPVEVEAVADSDDAVEISVDVPSGGTTVEIPVDDVTPGTMVVLVNKDGTEEVVRKSGVTETGVVVVLDEDATIKVIDNSKHFEDVHPVDHWAEEAVDFVTARGIYNGTSATTFSPDNPMTRGMLAVVLHNLEDNPDHDFDGTFHDVADGSWYEDGIHWAADEGIVSGYGNGLYGPDDHITREQLAVMLWRYAGSPESNHDVSHFTDEDKISGYALQAIRWANENGIINGKGGGILDPKGNATRAQVAQMLKNFITNAF